MGDNLLGRKKAKSSSIKLEDGSIQSAKLNPLSIFKLWRRSKLVPNSISRAFPIPLWTYLKFETPATIEQNSRQPLWKWRICSFPCLLGTFFLLTYFLVARDGEQRSLWWGTDSLNAHFIRKICIARKPLFSHSFSFQFLEWNARKSNPTEDTYIRP